MPLLIGKNILNKWEAAWNIPKGKLRVKIDGKNVEIDVQETGGGHSVVVIDPEPKENDIKEVRYVNVSRIETKENNVKIEESDKAENEVIKLLFDPNDYCKLCDGNLLGIRHLVECRRKSEKAAENETGEKEDNSDKVNRVEDKETETKLTPEEPKSVFPRLRTCTGVGDQATTEGELSSEMSRSQPREEKNHETLAENVSKLEYEEGEINAIVKEIEKAEKIYTHDMELIRVLERQVLSPQDRLRINEAETEAETLMETINRLKIFSKRRKKWSRMGHRKTI